MAYIFGSIWDRLNRNALNNISKSVEQQGKSIQDLVANGQLTPTEYATLIKSINNMAEKSEVRENTHTRPINVSEMDTETKKLFTGGAVAVVGENAVGSENVKPLAITPDKISFMNHTKNLFSGVYYKGYLRLYGSYYLANANETTNGRAAIIPIEANETYTISTQNGDNTRFRVGVQNTYPIFTSDTGEIGNKLDKLILDDDTYDTKSGFTFTNDGNGKYLIVYVSHDGTEPRLQVEKGGVATGYVGGGYIPNKFVEKHPIEVKDLPVLPSNKMEFMINNPENIFNNLYNEGYYLAYGGSPRVVHTFRYDAGGGICAIIPVEHGKTYYIKKFDTSDRLRIATFATEPLDDSSPLRGFEVGSSADEYSVKTEIGENYLVVQVSNTGQKPRLVINTLGFTENYISNASIDKKYLPSSESNDIKRKHIVTGNYSEYIKTEPFLGTTFLGKTVSTLSANDVYGLYDALLDDHPGIFTKQIVGYATNIGGGENTNLPIYEYALTAPDNRMKIYPGRGTLTGIHPAPTLLFTSGVHGDEKGAIYGLYHFIKQVLDKKSEIGAFASLLSNFTIKILPVVSPTGVNSRSRLTANGVNINRNFGYKWDAFPTGEKGSAPYSEHETQTLVSWFEDNPNATAYFDYHNFNRVPSGYLEHNSYHFSPIEDLDKVFSSALRRWSHEWKDRYMASYSELGNVAYGYLQTDYYKDTPSTINDAHYKFGIPLTATPEAASQDPTDTSAFFTTDSCEISTEIIMNYTLSVIDNFIK